MKNEQIKIVSDQIDSIIAELKKSISLDDLLNGNRLAKRLQTTIARLNRSKNPLIAIKKSNDQKTESAKTK